MTTTDAQDDINAMRARFDIAMTGAWPYPPAEPTQESTMPINHRVATEQALHESDVTLRAHDKPRGAASLQREATAHALLAIHDLLDERLPEPTTRDDWLDEPVPVPRPEPVDVTEEPPVGSQVTDRDGEVWGRFEEGWQVWDALGYMEWSGVSDPWSAVRGFGALRPTTDADRERVGLSESSVNSSEGSVNEGECSVDTAPDVDPDEALAKVIFDDAYGSHEGLRLAQLDVARAAREHIASEPGVAETLGQCVAHEKASTRQAEAEVERLTRENDAFYRMLNSQTDADGNALVTVRADDVERIIETNAPRTVQDAYAHARLTAATNARARTHVPRVGSQCPRCGRDVVTGQPTPSCVADGKHDADICAVWCKEENYADDLCAPCEAIYETGARDE